jgi:simple sugar transport system permease protein
MGATIKSSPPPATGVAAGAGLGARAARIARRPELGAVAGALAVYLFFVIVAGSPFYGVTGMGNWLTQAAELGIVAVPVAMLMVSGEFDLSVGSMMGAASMIVAICVGTYGWPVWLAVLLAFAVAALIGLANGYLVIKTGLPSFIVTLATLFILRGVTIGVSRQLTGSTNVSLNGAHTDSWVSSLLVSTSGTFSIEVVWWLVIVVVASFVLMRTGFGNWIYSTGGDQNAAHKVGVKVNRVRITLFVYTALAATLVAVMQVLTSGSGDVLRGEQEEFEAIIAAVIGGCLLTGGYGTAIGAAFGALTFGMANLGINYAGWDQDWFKAFLGVMLLLAVVGNNWIRKRALEAR